MTNPSPIQQSERTIIVDIIRGFALTGVLFANFTGYNTENLPSTIVDSISSPFDKVLININTVFFEWKFYTIFSVLFGYGFGLVLSSLEKRNINPNSFFLRRMFWLFVIGVIHTLFWWADVLHYYAICGAFLLSFKKLSIRTILTCSLLFMFIVPPLLSLLFQNDVSYFTDKNMQILYDQYLNRSVIDVFKANISLYYKAFIVTFNELHDLTETLGRFLFGYFLLRVGLFESVETKKSFFRKILLITAPVMIAYFIIWWMSLKEMINTDGILWEPFIKLGILSTSTFYASVLVILFIKFGRSKFFVALQSLGKMTLTNYLLVSAFLVTLLYGIGFGKLGTLPMHIVWVCAFVWLLFEIAFSIFWLNKFRFGSVEWIWRQLTYKKKIRLLKTKR
jgi:uncharacterized protein